MGTAEFNYFVSIIVFWSFLTNGLCQEDVIIDSATDLDALLFEPTTCTYSEFHSELESCKVDVEESCSSGFWSSCLAQSCEISIVIGRLGSHGRVPNKIHIFTYFGGSGAELQLRWKRNFEAPYTRIETISFTQPGWFRYTRDLTGLIDFSIDSIINLRFASIPIPDFDADIVDQIIFSFGDDNPDPSLPCEGTTPTTPIPISSIAYTTLEQSTVDTPIPPYIIDSRSDLEAVLFEPTSCTYAGDHSDLDSCKIDVEDSCSSGFWSSCLLQSCEISILIRNLGSRGRLPKKIHIFTYFGGNGAEIQLRWKINAAAPFVRIETMPFTHPGWFRYTRDLTGLADLTMESIINLRFASIPIPEFDADIVDRIIFSFEENAADPLLPCEPTPPLIIDTVTDLESVLFEPTTCTYEKTHTELETCKIDVDDSCSSGFWGSCLAQVCDISILIGNLGAHRQIPRKVHIFYYYGGSGAEILFRWKRTADSAFIRLETIPFTQPGWFRYTRDLTSLIDFTTDSIINLRFASIPVPEFDADIVDQIIFTFGDDSPDPPLPCNIGTTIQPVSADDSTPEPPTTSKPSTTPEGPTPPDPPTTHEPTTTDCPVVTTPPPYTATTFPSTTIGSGIPDLMLDVDSDLVAGWINVDCTYESRPQDFIKCPNLIPYVGWNSEGLWSSCQHSYCTIMFALGRYINPLPPTAITVTSFVTGTARVEISVRAKGSDYGVGIISGTNGWSNSTFDLTHLPLDEESRIFVEPNSSSYPDSVDIIDKVFIHFK